MKKTFTIILLVFVVLLLDIVFNKTSSLTRPGLGYLSNTTSPFHDDTSIVFETASMKNNNGSNQFWLDSGGLFYVHNDHSETVQGDLPTYSHWRILYAETNPTDTDDGYHPQNILRLITKKMFENSTQEVYARITNDNLSQSPNRNMSNGILLMSRYKNSDNLYYAGIRVDGTAVIKEKVNGVYYTLAQSQIFPGDEYDKNVNPNLIPKHQWIGIKCDVSTKDDSTVIKLYMNASSSETWKELLTATDTAQKGAPPIIEPGHAGIRTDFMDVEFKNYILK